VTQWGVLLLSCYLVLGLSRIPSRKASRLAVVLTTIVIGSVMVSYGAIR
jgi:hypothetical protein